MNVVDKATATQLKNIEAKTGKNFAELTALIQSSGLAKHGEIRDMLKRDLGLGHGDANTLAILAREPERLDPQKETPAADDLLAAIYTGPKAGLRPVHEKVMAALEKFGNFEIAPKKGYVSLRRKKQFATLGPATSTKIELGLNMKDVPATDRLAAIPPGGMCQYKVRLGSVEEVDKELLAWLRTAYDASA